MNALELLKKAIEDAGGDGLLCKYAECSCLKDKLCSCVDDICVLGVKNEHGQMVEKEVNQ